MKKELPPKKKAKEKVIINTKFTQYDVVYYVSKDLKYRIFTDKMPSWGTFFNRYLLGGPPHDLRLLPENEAPPNCQPVSGGRGNLPEKLSLEKFGHDEAAVSSRIQFFPQDLLLAARFRRL